MEIEQDNICKKCGAENHCPCSYCKANKFTKPDDIVWYWKNKGNTSHCGKCGNMLFN